jgi:hypothetical protein
MAKHYCETCFHFNSLEGVCQRYPPTVIIMKGPMNQPQPASMYPPQKKTNTCGEWSPLLTLAGTDA